MPTQTLGDVLSVVYSRLDNNTQLYDRASVVTEINDAIKVCNLYCGVIQATIPMGTQGADLWPPIGQLVYPTPPGMIYPVAVDYEGRELTPLSLRQLALQHRSWATDTNSPSGRPVKNWAPIGWNQFVIHPRDSLGGRLLNVTGVMEPPILANDNDVIPLPNDYVEDLCSLAGSVLPVREGGRVFNAAQTTLFAAFLREMRVKSAFANLSMPMYYAKLQGRKPSTPVELRSPGE